MHATGTEFADLDDDLRLVSMPDAARFLSVSRGSLYDLLTTGQLASVHIGRSRRIPMGELRRYVRERLERNRSMVFESVHKQAGARKGGEDHRA